MSSSTDALSRTLKSITLTKFKELEKKRKVYQDAKASLLGSVNELDNKPYAKRQRLYEGLKELLPDMQTDTELKNIERWLGQSKFDSSISDEMLRSFEAKLSSQLDIRTRRLDLASLYSRLLTEWLESPQTQGDEERPASRQSSDDSFEVVEQNRLKQLVDDFEAIAFTAMETDSDAINKYLGKLFEGDIRSKALKDLRTRMQTAGTNISNTSAPFTEQTIQWCLKGLLANDLLRDDKKAILQEFLKDEVARMEICDVLNMRFIDLKNWEWDCDEKGLPVEPRPQLNGKYRIMMDEDILDSIFLHYIGTIWSIKTNGTIYCAIHEPREGVIWKQSLVVPNDFLDRRGYFLGTEKVSRETSDNIEESRQAMYLEDFFLSQLPATVQEGAGGYDDENHDDNWDNLSYTEPGRESSRPARKKKTPKQIKQQLLMLLASEVQIQKALHEQVAVVQSDFKWFGTSIPHSTILAVLRFMGVEEVWLLFFRKFLQAPLDMSPASGKNTRGKQGRIRKRGVPMAHALEKFFGETLLFFMDLAVNYEAGILLYRFYDDLWLVGQPEKCAEAWQEMKKFSQVMCLQFNDTKTGSVVLSGSTMTYEGSIIRAKLPVGPVTIGFLRLDEESGDWIIDQKQVDAHVTQLSKQLASATSILSWVRTWNSCIGRFFSHNFGEPANCFGRNHVDSILEIHNRMQETLFPGSNVCKYLKSVIAERFGVSDIPDAFIFIPEALGGLGVRNPFLGPLMVRENVIGSPSAMMDVFFESEQVLYNSHKREFEAMSSSERKRRLLLVYTDAYGEVCLPDKDLEQLDKFMSKSEFIRYRESTSSELRSVYTRLMETPRISGISYSPAVYSAMNLLEGIQPELRREDRKGTREELRWILTMYESEMMKLCGGMSIVERNLLPLGILTILRKRNVAWQMVL